MTTGGRGTLSAVPGENPGQRFPTLDRTRVSTRRQGARVAERFKRRALEARR